MVNGFFNQALSGMHDFLDSYCIFVEDQCRITYVSFVTGTDRKALFTSHQSHLSLHQSLQISFSLVFNSNMTHLDLSHQVKTCHIRTTEKGKNRENAIYIIGNIRYTIWGKHFYTVWEHSGLFLYGYDCIYQKLALWWVRAIHLSCIIWDVDLIAKSDWGNKAC